MESGKQRCDEDATGSRQHSEKYKRQISVGAANENIQKQLDELLAIQSIFDESTLTVDTDRRCGQYIAYPNITSSPYYIAFNKNGKQPDKGDSDQRDMQKMEVQHLPRIEFTFALDDFYPSDDPPAFLISCQWLSTQHMSQLCEQLDKLYDESRSEILYSWFTFLRDDVLALLNFETELDVTWLIDDYSDSASNTVQMYKNNYIPKKYRGPAACDRRVVANESNPNLLRILRDYNEYRREELFSNEWFSCNICFSRKQGRDCVMFCCNHTNCVECVNEYFKMQITEGAVYALKCPQHKCNAQATPGMIRKIVGDELFRRYDELLLATALNSMNDIVYCPRKLCQSPVVAEADADLAVCPVCSFAFCTNCKYTYHGVSPCRLFKTDVDRMRVLNEYNNGTDAEKKALEKRYGEELLKRELETAQGMLLSEKWIENFSKACPKCKANIEKIDGCNKMFCNRCQSGFCWICLELLSPVDPYSHFRRFKSKCFNKLFVGIMDQNENYYANENDDDDDDDVDDDLDDDVVQLRFEINH